MPEHASRGNQEMILSTYHPLNNLEDWDNLIILDACRYDKFKKLNKYKGNLAKRLSFSSHTREWLHSFKSIDLKKKVDYFSGNPFIGKFYFKKDKIPMIFNNLHEIWDYGWDKRLKTVTPKRMNREVERKYNPRNHTIIHYMQPHFPFIGETKFILTGANRMINDIKTGGDEYTTVSAYTLVKQGKEKSETIIRAYEENLEFVLKEIKPVLNRLEGRTVITSDHGELLGERGEWDHRVGACFIKELSEVPWFTYEK